MVVVLVRAIFFALLFFGVIALLNGCSASKYLVWCSTHPGEMGCQ